MATKKSTGKKAAAKQPVEVKAQDEPNIIWADRNAEPPAEVRIGMTHFELPDADEQRAGFYHAQAARLIRQIPGFKEFRKKG